MISIKIVCPKICGQISVEIYLTVWSLTEDSHTYTRARTKFFCYPYTVKIIRFLHSNHKTLRTPVIKVIVTQAVKSNFKQNLQRCLRLKNYLSEDCQGVRVHSKSKDRRNSGFLLSGSPSWRIKSSSSRQLEDPSAAPPIPSHHRFHPYTRLSACDDVIVSLPKSTLSFRTNFTYDKCLLT